MQSAVPLGLQAGSEFVEIVLSPLEDRLSADAAVVLAALTVLVSDQQEILTFLDRVLLPVAVADPSRSRGGDLYMFEKSPDGRHSARPVNEGPILGHDLVPKMVELFEGGEGLVGGYFTSHAGVDPDVVVHAFVH